MRALKKPRWEDYEFTYMTGNRFEYLGNGFTEEEGRGESNEWFQTIDFEAYRKLGM